jgi:undecaprenyl-diphosphatase
MDILQSIILGLIQGITEWLPISSTGHLRIAEHYFGLTVPALFDVMLHAGTLIVTLVYFRKDIRKVLKALAKLDFKSDDGTLIPLIITGTIPTVTIGFLYGNELDTTLSTIIALGVGFLVSGVILYFSKFGKENRLGISYIDALIIGVMQGLAIIPSVSRSGFTIAAALLLGIKREKAFKFSFLLSIPSILGALVLTMYQQNTELITAGVDVAEILAGVIVSILVSFFALKFLWRSIASKKFHLFAFYCFALGAVLVILSFVGT